jgi:hypothetical protein
LRRSSLAGDSGALIATLVAVGGFNAIEGFPPLLVLIALLSIGLRESLTESSEAVARVPVPQSDVPHPVGA